jgi:hypothetical protein
LTLRRLTKAALVKAGARSSERTLHVLSGLLDYVELGFWLRMHDFRGGLRLQSCADIPDAVAAAIGERPVLYLQFGARDESMVERWARALRHPETQLRVFDSLDERRSEWLPARGRGHTGDSPNPNESEVQARTSDPRARYHTGTLAELVASYDGPTCEVIVASFDTDHYATTKTALEFLRDRLPEASYLVFDQLNHRADELRAFHEFLIDSKLRFELFAANRELSCFAFRRR